MFALRPLRLYFATFAVKKDFINISEYYELSEFQCYN
jgi:hypothetical protein